MNIQKNSEKIIIMREIFVFATTKKHLTGTFPNDSCIAVAKKQHCKWGNCFAARTHKHTHTTQALTLTLPYAHTASDVCEHNCKVVHFLWYLSLICCITLLLVYK